jgi:hypothetical protein
MQKRPFFQQGCLTTGLPLVACTPQSLNLIPANLIMMVAGRHTSAGVSTGPAVLVHQHAVLVCTDWWSSSAVTVPDLVCCTGL